MATLSRKFQVYSDGSIRHVSLTPRFRLAWDDENPDYNYRCRTQMPQDDPIDTDNPPAVMRFYPEPREKSGDYRVNLAIPYDWEPAIVTMNGGGEQGERAWGYLVGPSRAQFNSTGWPKMAYVGMCGNQIEILERTAGWVKFKTLKQSDVSRVAGWTIENHPEAIHQFTCITWVRDNSYPDGGFTRRIESTGTPRGKVYYPLISVEGFAWIPSRHIVNV